MPMRQIVESIYDKLFNALGFHKEPSHELSGMRAHLALHNFCIWLNDQLGRSWLAFAELGRW
jgi:hypothetical protein